MNIFSRSEDDRGMGQFILTEIRDLRKGMEGRDGELRGAVATLSESVSSCHSSVRVIRQEIDDMGGNIKQVRKEVDAIAAAQLLRAAKDESAWNGPKKILVNMALVGAAAAAVIALLNLAPRLFPLLPV